MVDIKKGLTHKHASSEKLIRFFRNHNEFEGHFYVGYPILFAAGESLTIDALWISKKFGVLVFDVIEGIELNNREDIQDEIFGTVESQLTAYPNLKNRRTLAVNIEVLTYAPAVVKKKINFKCAFNDEDLLREISALPEWKNSELYNDVVSIIQSVINLKVKNKRDNVQKTDSKGYKIKSLENTIATLDNDQEEAVIEFFEGLQRIRGLAGSGKTIVLALKAAYLHARYPNWDIAVTFNTRSLKTQFEELITRFCIEKKRESPDWTKLKVINAWGRPKSSGIYYETCIEHGITYHDFNSASRIASSVGKKMHQAFDVACDIAIKEIKNFKEKYDAILVDEAQDLSESFLNLCYKILKEPKRLIYAYDELQKLNEGSPLRSPKAMLGKEAEDTILKKCYRNSRPLLVTAHALGFGIYSENGLVQFFDQPQLWKDVGYQIKEGALQYKRDVKLYRTNEYSPEYLENHSPVDDLIIFKSFSNAKQQAKWVSDQIESNLKDDELLYKDIIVINPIALTTKNEVSTIRSLLFDKNINSHIAGEINADVFFEESSITFTGINRAKGNEVPMVYIINANDCYSNAEFENLELTKRRNILFTAITRSKAWVRVCGIGNRMDKLIKEYEEVKLRNFELHFTYPTETEIKKMNLIHRDISESDKHKIKQEVNLINEIDDILFKIRTGEAYIEDYPLKQQEILRKLL